eukprot:TRINITY_DN5440_c0_g1_i1.p1 TRINITY_DN5440_c0_g1~~TRINITY_DN5440_c0_g1_i1.p1  ORF type:complete len:159 (+),score=17.89 TRINITY_DN5440_c0_g1_i1:260-736(+)
MDTCWNVNDPRNQAQLTKKANYPRIDELWQDVCSRFSRTDFYALFSIAVLENVLNNGNPNMQISLPFQAGRTDRAECGYREFDELELSRLPTAATFDEVERVMMTQLGFNLEETIVLLSLHEISQSPLCFWKYYMPGSGPDSYTGSYFESLPFVPFAV